MLMQKPPGIRAQVEHDEICLIGPALQRALQLAKQAKLDGLRHRHLKGSTAALRESAKLRDRHITQALIVHARQDHRQDGLLPEGELLRYLLGRWSSRYRLRR